jgi:hypothetical protein
VEAGPRVEDLADLDAAGDQVVAAACVGGCFSLISYA